MGCYVKYEMFLAMNYLSIYTLGFLYTSSSGSANAQLTGCFRPWKLSLNIGLKMFHFGSFMSCLHFLLAYCTGEFQALRLIVLAEFWLVPFFGNLVWNDDRFVSLT